MLGEEQVQAALKAQAARKESDARRVLTYDLTLAEKEAVVSIAWGERVSLSRWVANTVRAELARRAGAK